MQPLNPFQSPLALLENLGVPLESGLVIAIGVIFVVWLLHALVLVYHWFRYSHGSIVALPALFVHVLVSATIMAYALTGSLLPSFI